MIDGIEYQGQIEGDDRLVFRATPHGRQMLRHHREVANHAAAFGWGERTRGAMQLAVAMLADAVGRERALPLYKQFFRECIEALPRDQDFTIARADVRVWAEAAEQPASDARAAYHDPTYPERPCDHCGRPYQGPAVFCCFECAEAAA